MRPIKILLAATAGAALIAPGVVAAAAPASSSTPTITLMKTNKGKLLSSNGFVLYRFSHDKSGSKNTCVTIPGCAMAWPALTTSDTPTTGPGVKKSLLSTTKLPNGKKQVTYAGHPIYKYAFGTKHSTSYVGVNISGGFWYGVNANGQAVK